MGRGRPADGSEDGSAARQPTLTPTVLLFVPGADASRLRRNLRRWGYTVQAVESQRAALRALREAPVDIVVAGGRSRRSLLRFMGQVGHRVPVAKRVALSADHNEEAVRELVNRAGADAVLGDPPDARELHRTLDRLWEELSLQLAWAVERTRPRRLVREPSFEALVAAQVRERTQQLRQQLQREKERNRSLRQLNASLKIQSTTDPLTGLFNRREFHNRLRVEWGRYRRYHRPLSLIMLDIDHFKQVNDTYGHDCGDNVLVTLAGLIRRHQRSHDITCRYGGEEFMVLMPETPLSAGFHVAEGLRRLIRRHRFACDGERLPVRVSLGVAGAMEHDPGSVDAFVKLADHAMYAAKRAGRNRTVIVDRHEPQKVLRETPADKLEA